MSNEKESINQHTQNQTKQRSAAAEVKEEKDDDLIFGLALEGGMKKAVAVMSQLLDSEDGKKLISLAKQINESSTAEQLKGIAFLIKHLGEEICEQLRRNNELRELQFMHATTRDDRNQPFENVTDEKLRQLKILLDEYRISFFSIAEGGDANGSETLS